MIRSTVFANLIENKTKPSVAVAPAAAAPRAEVQNKVVRVCAWRLNAAALTLELRIRVLDMQKAESPNSDKKSFFIRNKITVLINPATGHKQQVSVTPFMGETLAPREMATTGTRIYR
jgi:hypothetical protein